MLCLVLALPGTARAANDDEDIKNDARTEGYQPKAQVAQNGTALTWLTFSLMSVIALAVLFKDAKRTHLD